MKTIDDLRSEHEPIGQMVDRFEAEIEAAVERGAIDADAIDQLLVFFEEQVGGHHHGKQDRVLFPRLLTRAQGEDAELVLSLIDDHASEREMLAAMRCELEAAAYGEPNSLAVLAREGRRFVARQRRCSRYEEVVVFPLAASVLSAQDDAALGNGFRRLDEVWERPLAKAALALCDWLDRRHEPVAA